MRVPNQQNRPFTGANMTPMIDVVFLLIIFFLVSSHLAKQESRLPIDLPVAATHGDQDSVPVSLTLTLNSGGDLLVAGKSIPKESLLPLFASVVSKEGDSASLRIRSDEKVKYRDVQPVLRSAVDAGLLDIKLAVKNAEDVR